MKVSAILEQKGSDVATVRADQPMMNVIEQLSEKNIGAIVITSSNNEVEGIISERDVVRSLAQTGASVFDQPVGSFMTRSVVTCGEDEASHELMTKMTAGRFRHLPVVRDSKLVGIISIGDIVKARIAEVQREAEALRDYISSS